MRGVREEVQYVQAPVRTVRTLGGVQAPVLLLAHASAVEGRPSTAGTREVGGEPALLQR